MKTYIAIDLKSFFASVECVERGLDPLTTRLVVADESRTDKTICLAVTPALKAFGIPGRARLFEVKQQAKKVHTDFLIAKPRMALYMEYSTKIFDIYLKYVSAEDMHVYSVDEVFIDATSYLKLYNMTARELAMTMIQDVLKNTGITATAGVGPNMYLCKIAMDVEAKHIPADKDGVRIAELDEMSYREKMWDHKPITDFWRIGRGIAAKLEKYGMYTLGDVARCSLGGPNDIHNEDLLYRLFGVNAELLIDHAWGYEPTTIADIKGYTPSARSIGKGQVLKSATPISATRLIMKEMADGLALDLSSKGVATSQIVIVIGYDQKSLEGEAGDTYQGEVTTDYYGRLVPKHAQATINLGVMTSSASIIIPAVERAFDEVVDNSLYARRLNIAATNIGRDTVNLVKEEEQLDMFTDYQKRDEEIKAVEKELKADKSIQKAMLEIKERYGKNAILKGMNFEEGATAKERNKQIGGHNA